MDTTKQVQAFGRTFRFSPDFSEERVFKFIVKVDFDSELATGCWRWKGYKGAKGYGIAVNETQRQMQAHRVAYEFFVGPIPKGFHLHHRTEEPFNCIGPNCVNPEHLLPVEPREHVLKYTPNNITTIRAAATHCPKGHELTGENIYINPGNKARICITCRRAWNRLKAKQRRGSEREPRTRCLHGHELTEENTYFYLGVKMCRACHGNVTLRRYHEKRAESGPKTHCKHDHSRAEHGIERAGGWSCKACMAANGARRWEAIKAARRTVDGVECCAHGHSLTEENLYQYGPADKPKIVCRTCWKEAGRRAYEARKLKYAIA